jgi:sirohydrochlorin ferrochelatase
MAHGSRSPDTNRELAEWTKQLQSQDLTYSRFEHAFLEIGTPTLMQAVETLLDHPVTHIDIYPVFFNSGRHVGKDIPQQVADVMERFSDIEVRLLEHFGANKAMAEVMADHILGMANKDT